MLEVCRRTDQAQKGFTGLIAVLSGWNQPKPWWWNEEWYAGTILSASLIASISWLWCLCMIHWHEIRNVQFRVIVILFGYEMMRSGTACAEGLTPSSRPCTTGRWFLGSFIPFTWFFLEPTFIISFDELVRTIRGSGSIQKGRNLRF